MHRKEPVFRLVLWLFLFVFLFCAVYAGARLFRLRDDIDRARAFRDSLRAQDACDASGEPAASTLQEVHQCPVDFAPLREKYPALCAWLSGCGGEIDTPIAQAADNEYYLRHLLDGSTNILGTPFLDSRNQRSFADDQSFCFGHHMDTGGGAFSPLLSYTDPAFYERWPYFTLHTPEGCFRAQVFAAFPAEETAYPYTREFESPAAKQAFLDDVRARSVLKTDVSVTPADRILTLSTCTSKTNDLRFVVCTKLVPIASTHR